MASSAYAAWVAAGRPWGPDARPVRALGDLLAAHGYTVYYHGDERHLTNDPPEDHTPFSATGWPGKSPYPRCLATDIMPPTAGQKSKLNGRSLPSLAALGARLLADKQSGRVALGWLKYMNWTDAGGNIWHDKWTPGYDRSSSGDSGHIHLSCRTDFVDSLVAEGYDPVALVQGDDMVIYGWDASHYDAVPDGARVASEGIKFMTHKAGGDKEDAELSAWWSAMRPYRSQVLLGAYWVLYPGSPSVRADAFLARLDSQCPGWRDGPFILQADCEIWGGDASTKPGKADIKAFCDRLVARVPKLRPVVYASKGQYGDGLTGLGYPLWNARYPLNDRAGSAGTLYAAALAAGSGWGAYSGQTPAIWQFSSSATIAGQTTCDANAFRGTLAELINLLAPGWMTLEDPEMELDDKYGDEAWPSRTVRDRFSDDAKLRDVFWGDAKGIAAANLPANSPLAKLLNMPAQIAQLSAAVAALNPTDFAAAVVSQLPDNADPISQDEVTAAVQAAFHQAFGNVV